jgi:hypothetical protein
MNYGRKIEKVEHVTLAGAEKALRILRSGQLCRVDAVKKDGTLRTYSSCRTGVSKGVTGTGMSYNPQEKGLITVYEFGVGHRTIAIDRIVGIKHGGVWYDLNGVNNTRFTTDRRLWSGRTVMAENSALY